MSADPGTLAAYAEHASAYAGMVADTPPDPSLKRFIKAMLPGGSVLDLGCGPGGDAAAMRRAGLRPDAVDAAPEMVDLANRHHALGARVARFDAIKALAAYDGIWANFSLLHAPKAAFPGLLQNLHHALRPGGLIHLGMKTGRGERRDRLGRFYAFYSRGELIAHLREAGFTVIWEQTGKGVGLAGTLDPFILVQARA